MTRLDITQPGRDALVASSYLGGAGADAGHALAVDAQGHASVLGSTQSHDFPVTTQAGQERMRPGARGQARFVTRLDTTQAAGAAPIVYSTYLEAQPDGGEGRGGIAMDTDGHVYVLGSAPARDAARTAARGSAGQAPSSVTVLVLDTQAAHPALVAQHPLPGMVSGGAMVIDAQGTLHLTGIAAASTPPHDAPHQREGPGDVLVAQVVLGDDPCALPYPPPDIICPTATLPPTVERYPPPDPTMTPTPTATAMPPNTVFYVDVDATGAATGASWADAFPSLQAGLAAAQRGDELWVAAGTYTPHPSDRTVSFVLPAGVALYGGFAGTETHRDERDWTTHVTTLSGEIGTPGDPSDNSYHVVQASQMTQETVLDGVLITHGNANVGGQEKGAGVYAAHSDLRITNVTFTANQAQYGGGLYAIQSRLTLGNVRFQHNTATYVGGGMRILDASHAVLEQVTFRENHTDEVGGGLASEQSSLTLTDVTLVQNSAGLRGGGLANEQSSPTLTDVIFHANTATNRGGGLYNTASHPTLTDVTFHANTARYGGGLYNTASRPTLTDVTFHANTATDRGGGLSNTTASHAVLEQVTFQENHAERVGGGMSNEASHPTLTDVTFQGNTATNDGGGVFNERSHPLLTDVTFVGNTAVHGGGLYNDQSGPTLTDVTFRANTATDRGGGSATSPVGR